MKSIQGKTALVTGASSGIGKGTVELLLKQGATVYAAARRVENMKELESLGAKTVQLDVTDEASIAAAVGLITGNGNTVDILVNNAGYGSYGAIEDVPITEARRQFEVNLFGLAALTRLVLPGMRDKRYGKIVNISSMGGRVFTPFGGWYHATKHALEGWSDCLRLEVKPFGVDVIIVEPGGIKTPWGSIAAGNLRKTSANGAYAVKANKIADSMEKTYSKSYLTDPLVIAKTIVQAVTAGKPKRRYIKGLGAVPALFVRRWCGDAVYERMIGLMM